MNTYLIVIFMNPNYSRPHFQNVKLKLCPVKLGLSKKFIRICDFDCLVDDRLQRLSLKDSINSYSSLSAKWHQPIHTLRILIQQTAMVTINKTVFNLSANSINWILKFHSQLHLYRHQLFVSIHTKLKNNSTRLRR